MFDELVPELQKLPPVFDELFPVFDELVPELQKLPPVFHELFPVFDELVPELQKLPPVFHELVSELQQLPPVLQHIPGELLDLLRQAQQICGEQVAQDGFLKLRALLQGIDEVLGRFQPDPVHAWRGGFRGHLSFLTDSCLCCGQLSGAPARPARV